MYGRYIKRILDIIFAVSMSILLILPLFLVALIIKMSSKGPVFFKQERYGKNSTPFMLYKFRSMTDKAPIKKNSEFSDITNYVTPFGMFIRKTSIDELPQLINILKGDMSFIGPRPLARTDSDVLRLRRSNGGDRIRPGISGLAQVNGRNNLSDNDKAAFDAKYVAKLNFQLDFLLVIETIAIVLRRDGVFKSQTAQKIDESGESND